MEIFGAGFAPGKTPPGHSLETDGFKVIFGGVHGGDVMVAEALEIGYDWSPVMSLVLEAAAARSSDLAELERMVQADMADWLAAFSGWGLLAMVEPRDEYYTRYFMAALLHTWDQWSEALGGTRSQQKVFDTVKGVLERIDGSHLESMASFDVAFEEFANEGVSFKINKRLKLLVVYIEEIEVQFIVEKKRVNRDLVDLAAEEVVKLVNRVEDIDELEIPQTLKVPVVDKFYDYEWAESCMNYLNDTMDEDVDFESSEEEDMEEVGEEAEPFKECEAETAAGKSLFLETMQWVVCCCGLLIASAYICS